MTEEDCITKCLEDKMDDCIHKCQEAQKEKEPQKEKPKSEKIDGLPTDWMGEHNVITRLMSLSVTAMFVYAFLTPLPLGYVETVSYTLLFVIMIITFGLNSLKVLGTLIDKWKR